MASRPEVQCWFIDPMLAYFTPPRNVEAPELALKTYINALVRFDEISLKTGITRLQEGARTRAWPLVKECVVACEGASVGRQGPVQAKHHGPLDTQGSSLVSWSLKKVREMPIWDLAVEAGCPVAVKWWVISAVKKALEPYSQFERQHNFDNIKLDVPNLFPRPEHLPKLKAKYADHLEFAKMHNAFEQVEYNQKLLTAQEARYD